jgi:hypothetical protein
MVIGTTSSERDSRPCHAVKVNPEGDAEAGREPAEVGREPAEVARELTESGAS